MSQVALDLPQTGATDVQAITTHALLILMVKTWRDRACKKTPQTQISCVACRGVAHPHPQRRARRFLSLTASL